MAAVTNNRTPVTLKDVAKATGFSANTVSHALAGKPDISIATKKIISDKAREMGYITNALASFLRSGISKTISIIVGDISNPHFAIIVKEVQTLLQKRGYTCTIFNTEENKDLELRAITASISQNADGIIICPTPNGQKNLDLLRQYNKRFVLLGRRFDNSDANYVVCDDENGGYVAAQYLLANGHKEILFLNGPRDISSARERLHGYRRALTEAGAEYRSNLVFTVPILGDEEKIAQALAKAQKYTAVLGFSDLVAWQAICCLEKQGRSVPKDCSVIGFDNISFTYPLKLTSISSSKTTMAKKAVDLLMKELTNTGAPIKQVVLETKLIEGATVKPR